MTIFHILLMKCIADIDLKKEPVGTTSPSTANHGTG